MLGKVLTGGGDKVFDHGHTGGALAGRRRHALRGGLVVGFAQHVFGGGFVCRPLSAITPILRG